MKIISEYLAELFGLQSKTVLITGATGQIGHSLCEAFINLGVIVIGADIEINEKKIIKDSNILYVCLDITNKESVEKVFERLYQNYNCIDILINNAGASIFESFEERTEVSFDWVSNVNLKGSFFCIREYAKSQKERKQHGNIINVASIYGVISPDPRVYLDGDRKNSEIYGATKAGIIQMTKYFAVHLAQNNIRVNAISPGGIFNSENPQGKHFVKEYSKRNPMGRMANLGEIAGSIIFLSSDASSYITGQNLVVDGGMSCW